MTIKNQDNSCVFCKIIAGELPASVIYEDDFIVSFMDINPVTDGHVLVIPKEHTLWVWDIEKYTEYMDGVRKMAMILRKSFDTDMIFSKIYGLDIPHAHTSIFPAHPSGRAMNSSLIEENYNRILKSCP